MCTIVSWLAGGTALGVTMQANCCRAERMSCTGLRGAHSCATAQGSAEVGIPMWMGSWLAAPEGRGGSQVQGPHQCIVTKTAFAYRQLLQTSSQGGHRRLEMSSFLSWEEAAKVSCPFSTLSMYPAGLARRVIGVQRCGHRVVTTRLW